MTGADLALKKVLILEARSRASICGTLVDSCYDSLKMIGVKTRLKQVRKEVQVGIRSPF